jgi:mono/diheme cytochrome c family protein
VSKFPQVGLQADPEDFDLAKLNAACSAQRLLNCHRISRCIDRPTQEQSDMKRVPITVTVIVFLALTGVASAQDKAQIERGMKVFADQKCTICHAIEGKGNAKGKLDGVGAKLKADEIREWLANPVEMAAKVKADRKPPMKAYTNLSKEDLDGLIAYLSNLKK